jgi:hypothetical protein
MGPDRAVELARDGRSRRLAGAPAWPDRHRRHRHPPADPRDPPAGRAPCGACPRPGRASFDIASAGRGGARLRGSGRARPGPRRDLRPDLPLGRDALGLARRLWPARPRPPPGRRDRLWRQAQHPALACGPGLRSPCCPPPRPPKRFWRITPTAFSCRTGRATRRPPGVCRADDPASSTATDLPIFGICLGHQMLAPGAGCATVKMNHGHHGANHPVKDLETGKVEITSMNHGFTVDSQTLPDTVRDRDPCERSSMGRTAACG